MPRNPDVRDAYVRGYSDAWKAAGYERLDDNPEVEPGLQALARKRVVDLCDPVPGKVPGGPEDVAPPQRRVQRLLRALEQIKDRASGSKTEALSDAHDIAHEALVEYRA